MLQKWSVIFEKDNGNGRMYPPELFDAMTVALNNVTLTPVTVTTATSPDIFPTLLPLSIKVAARTMAMDLVPVVPMSPPSALIFGTGGALKKTFRVYYVAKDGEHKVFETWSSGLSEAIGEIPDLDYVKYHTED